MELVWSRLHGSPLRSFGSTAALRCKDENVVAERKANNIDRIVVVKKKQETQKSIKPWEEIDQYIIKAK